MFQYGDTDSMTRLEKPGMDELTTTSCGIGELARTASFRGSFRRKSKRDPIYIINIRQQLNEQLKCLDARLENHLAMLWELQDFYKRRAEVENEYAKALDRLVKQIMLRHKSEKQKRELWPGFSTYTCWQTLLASTKRESKDHSILSDLYNNQLCNRFTEIADDIQRIYKRLREVGTDSHEELIKVLHELHSSMKTYHVYHGESKQAESKLKHVESQKSKVEQHASKGTLSRKFKSFEKQTEKKQAKYTENKLKALKARNDYILCIDAANASINKYYMHDLPDLIDAMDFGYHVQLSVAMKQHVSAEENCIKSKQACLELMNKCVTDLDQRTDKQRFLEIYNQAFSLPKKFDFQPHKGDEVCQISAQKTVQDELVERQKQISNRLNSLKLENDEVWKTLETAEKSLMVMLDSKDYDTTPLFQEEIKPPKSPLEYQKKRSDRLETEAFYLQKFREYLLGNNLMARLQAKSTSLTKALGEGSLGPHGPRPPSLPPKPKKRRIGGRTPQAGQPKLFGGSIEEYIEVTGNEIPLIVRSCIRVINLHGMHHQGVFRVSGSQHEINEFRNNFEKGDDPMFDISASRDINSVAGVLKLYFRELKEPLFPVLMFEELIACSRMETTAEFLERLKELLSSLPRPIIVVMRYLFSFLNHLTEYSDENMMDPYNLAICFGPTLLPIPQDRDQVQYQSNVNELIKNIIIHQEEVFPHDGGPVYEKCIIDESEQDTTDAVSDEEEDTTDAASEEETEVIEAVAQYDFTGRTERELTFKKGDILVVFNQVSSDWWEGAFNGREGLIPDKYIQLRQREEDRKSASSEEEKRRSTESLPAQAYNASLSVEDLDKSASQPNIAMTSSVHADFGASLSSTSTPSHGNYTTSPMTKSIEYGKLVRKNQGNSNPALRNQEDSGSTVSSEVELNNSSEDISQDIESALAEVMSGLKSLELQRENEEIQSKPLKPPPPSAKHHTPDLVLDLPVSAAPPSPKEKEMELDANSPDMSRAEVFAKNQCTIKKGMSMPRGVPGLPVEQTSPTQRSPPSDFGQVRRTYSSSSATIQRRKQELERELNRSPSPIWDQRSSDPPKPNVPSKIGGGGGDSTSTFLSSSSLAKVLPDRPADKPAAKPKPPVKMKPPVMKKPTRSPEVGKRGSNSSEESADVSHA